MWYCHQSSQLICSRTFSFLNFKTGKFYTFKIMWVFMHFAEIKLGQRIKNVYINLQTKSKVCFKILVLSANGVET